MERRVDHFDEKHKDELREGRINLATLWGVISCARPLDYSRLRLEG